MNIIIDFDGTVVTHSYPRIGKDIGSIPVLKRIVENGHNLILFTMRCGLHLDDSVEWFKYHNIPLYGIQSNPRQKEWTNSPKAWGDLIIDDNCLGIPLIHNPEFHSNNYVDWKKVEQMLINLKII